MVEYLLHNEIYMPTWAKNQALQQQRNLKEVKLSFHFKNDHSPENCDDKHNIDVHRLFEIVRGLMQSPIVPFEIKMVGNGSRYSIEKQVIRTSYDSHKDISIVLSGNKIVTAWLNNKIDSHSTLNKSKYFCPKIDVWSKLC